MRWLVGSRLGLARSLGVDDDSHLAIVSACSRVQTVAHVAPSCDADPFAFETKSISGKTKPLRYIFTYLSLWH